MRRTIGPAAQPVVSVAVVVAVAALLVLCAPAVVGQTAPTQTVRVELDGSGDYTSLADALTAVPSGTVIRLGAGTHTLTRVVSITKVVMLVGAGSDQTVVACEGSRGLDVGWGGALDAVDIAFTKTQSAGTPVYAWEGRSRFERCLFSGAAGQNSAGLIITTNAIAEVIDCVFLDNQTDGVIVSGAAVVELTGSTFQGNTGNGLVLRGTSSGIASGNQFLSNGKHGVWVTERASSTIEGNTCRENTWNGIAFHANASGIVRGNVILMSRSHGIELSDQTRVILDGNTVQGSGNGGIVYFKNATGVARGNRCLGNGTAGIHVGGQASPLIESNVATGNTYGIMILSTARPTVRTNSCSENGAGDLVDQR